MRQLHHDCKVHYFLFFSHYICINKLCVVGNNNVGRGPGGSSGSSGNAVQGGAGGDGGDNNGNVANGGDFNSGDFSGNGGNATGNNGNGGDGGVAIGGESNYADDYSLCVVSGIQASSTNS